MTAPGAAITRILVVEDDPAILRGVADNLRWDGHEVTTARTADEGWSRLQDGTLDLAILDVMLPGATGFDLCRRARAQGIDLPILFLTARGQETDRVMGLDLGADDYVTKPFSVPELLARVRALLRRTLPDHALPERLAFDDVVVDFTRYEATRAGAPLAMAPKEFGVLRLLAARGGQAVTRTELLREVWGYDAYPTTRTVDNHVAQLRAKLEADPRAPTRLLTVHGVGYRFVAEPAPEGE
ncbi:MAG: response regulator transcription factor [Gemmatimonadota bacterium]